MLYIIAVIIIALIGIILVKKSLTQRFDSLCGSFHIVRRHYEELNDKLAELKNKNKALEENFRKKLALYEMTKLISKSLDVNEVFSIFKKNIGQFIECKDCKFIEGEIYNEQSADVAYFPFRVQGRLLGSVIIEGLGSSGRDAMLILANQLHLVLKKVTLFNEIQRLSITDSLTEVFNRRYLLKRFNQEFKRALRYNMGISVIMLDIDFFKECNDKFGHFVGDVVLHEAANLIKQNIRNIDLIGRYGGEEFVVVLPSASTEAASIVAKRILESIRSHIIHAYDESIKITLSLGVASLSPEVKRAGELLDQSDFALYRAKKTGRNRVCIYGVYPVDAD